MEESRRIKMDDAMTKNLFKEHFSQTRVLNTGLHSVFNSNKKNRKRKETSMLKPKRKYMDKVKPNPLRDNSHLVFSLRL